MPFDSLLSRERIGFADRAIDRGALLSHAAALLAGPVEGPGLPAGDLARRLEAREQLASTGLGFGVAIPHARIPMLEEPRGAFLRLADPVDFAAPDGRPVDLVFAMAVPEAAVAGHLVQLAEIAERFSDEGFREALREAGDERELARLLLKD